MKYQANSRTDFRTPMTAMIDVVFLLLVFFVWTSSFQIEELLLPSSIATTAGVGDAEAMDLPPELETVVVAIRTDEQVRYSVNGRDLDDQAQLLRLLTKIAAIGTDVPVIIDPQVDVTLSAVIRAYDLARSVGFAKVHFAVE
jgi:biopolymer transport protein ExbD